MSNHSTVTLGELTEVNCPVENDDYRYCPHCGEPLGGSDTSTEAEEIDK